MSALVLDAGALIAIDRGDTDMHSELHVARRAGMPVRTNAMAVAQAWRDSGGRQVRLAKALRDMDVRSIHEVDGRKAGELLAIAGLTDAIDASVALLAGPADRVYTSDPDDLRKLCGAAGNNAAVIGC